MPRPTRHQPGLKPLLLLVGVAAAVAAGVGVMLWSVGPDLQPAVRATSRPRTPRRSTQALDSAAHSVQARDGGEFDQRAGRTARDGAPQARGAGPAGRRRRRERHDEGSGLRRQRSSWRARATSTRSRPSWRARFRIAAERARARACTWPCRGSPLSSATAGRAQRFGVPADEGRAGASTTNRCRPSPTSSRPAFPRSQLRRSPWSTSRAACCPRRIPTATWRTRDKMFEFAHRLEESYAQRIQEMLTPLVGPGRVRAQVVAQVDMSTTEQRASSTTRRARSCAASQTAEEAEPNGAGPPGRARRADQPAADAGVALPPGVPAAGTQAANGEPPLPRILRPTTLRSSPRAITRSIALSRTRASRPLGLRLRPRSAGASRLNGCWHRRRALSCSLHALAAPSDHVPIGLRRPPAQRFLRGGS